MFFVNVAFGVHEDDRVFAQGDDVPVGEDLAGNFLLIDERAGGRVEVVDHVVAVHELDFGVAARGVGFVDHTVVLAVAADGGGFITQDEDFPVDDQVAACVVDFEFSRFHIGKVISRVDGTAGKIGSWKCLVT